MHSRAVKFGCYADLFHPDDRLIWHCFLAADDREGVWYQGLFGVGLVTAIPYGVAVIGMILLSIIQIKQESGGCTT